MHVVVGSFWGSFFCYLYQTIHDRQNDLRSIKMIRYPQKLSMICNIIIISKLIIWSEALRIILKIVRITDCGSQLKKWSRIADHRSWLRKWFQKMIRGLFFFGSYPLLPQGMYGGWVPHYPLPTQWIAWVQKTPGVDRGQVPPRLPQERWWGRRIYQQSASRKINLALVK